ncbi:MAG: hypothetical protein ACJAZM_001688 [Cyclobacteriaceae bacterium]|jgi:hypothetical protein
MSEDISLLASAELKAVYLGRVNEEGYYKNDVLQTLDEDLADILTTFFLKPIKPGFSYTFDHEIDLKYNAAFVACQEIFANEEVFLDQSQQLLKLLYSVSENQNIIPGEFYTAYFERVYFEGRYVKAVGVFKSESKDPFLTIGEGKSSLTMEHQSGISIHNIHKGALIYDMPDEVGYQLTIFDKNSIQQPARFWVHDFLNVKPLQDEYFQTDSVLKLCKDFVKKGSREMDGVDKADLMNRTMDYFQTNETFHLPAFEAEVLKDEDVMRNFYEHREKFVAQSGQEELEESFEISAPAFEKAKRYVRSVIKLDKNFHVYVHGGREMIERGYDEAKGQHYYKLFFNEEQN